MKKERKFQAEFIVPFLALLYLLYPVGRVINEEGISFSFGIIFLLTAFGTAIVFRKMMGLNENEEKHFHKPTPLSYKSVQSRFPESSSKTSQDLVDQAFTEFKQN